MKAKLFIAGLFRSPINSALVTAMTILALTVPIAGFAKMYEEPKSFSLRDNAQEQIERKVLPKLDTERLLAEDRERGKDSRLPAPRRFAVAIEANFNLNNSGTWQAVPDGRVWRLRIQSPWARSHNLGITRFEMPGGAKLWIYDPLHKNVEGPYTARHRSPQGRLWTPIIEGDEIVVEVFVSAGVAQPVVEIGSVNQGYRGFNKDIPGGGTEGTCENDVICAIGDPWRNQIRAVGAYTVSGTATCTGTLLNNTAVPRKPYFLSANHCSVNTANDDTVVVYWNYQSAICGTHGPGSTTDNQTGSTFRASSSPSDFLLLELSTEPDLAFNVFHAGWDASGTIPLATVGIHHPAVDVKAISFANSAPETTTYLSPTPSVTGNHWRVLWNSGVTEGGSSGSCLFEATNGRCIGQLHGGPSGCGGADLHDYYGRLSVSWIGGGTSSSRLSDWLDEGGTGVVALDGDPHITTANGIHYDFQAAGEFVSLRTANGLEIQTRQAPIATTFNPGPDPHDGLATCVSLNIAVAARVGNHRVSYAPNLSGVPDPSGLQLRVDGALTTLGPSGLALSGGGRIAKTAASGGLEIDFPDNSVLLVTPGWWFSESKWYLNINVVRAPGMSGTDANATTPDTGGIAGTIVPGSWLPALPDGSSMGTMPSALHDRYADLYQKFANAWRVTGNSSLFDYAPGTSTATFSMATWPPENPPCVIPNVRPVRPASLRVAQNACRALVDKNTRKNCVFDVTATGNTGFAKTYLLSQRILTGATITTVREIKEPAAIVAAVTRTVRGGREVPTGTVQFAVNGENVGKSVKLDEYGHARWGAAGIDLGRAVVSATYVPSQGSIFLSSTGTTERRTTVGGGI